MNNKQAKLLDKLADKLSNTSRERSEIVVSLTQAKIITSRENFTRPFTNLGKVVRDKK